MEDRDERTEERNEGRGRSDDLTVAKVTSQVQNRHGKGSSRRRGRRSRRDTDRDRDRYDDRERDRYDDRDRYRDRGYDRGYDRERERDPAPMYFPLRGGRGRGRGRAPPPPPPCRFFNTARGCRDGDRCRFAHVGCGGYTRPNYARARYDAAPPPRRGRSPNWLSNWPHHSRDTPRGIPTLPRSSPSSMSPSPSRSPRSPRSRKDAPMDNGGDSDGDCHVNVDDVDIQGDEEEDVAVWDL